MSTERREIRPYPVEHQLESIFEACELKFGADYCEPDNSIQIDPATFLAHEPEVLFAAMDKDEPTFIEAVKSAVSASDLSIEDVWFTITARSHYLKLADLLYERRLTEVTIVDTLNLVSEVDLPNRADALCARFHGCEIALNLVYRDPSESSRQGHSPGTATPPTHGYWLARTTFILRYRDHRHLYQVKPLTDDARALLSRRGINLHRDTVRFLDVTRDEELFATASDLNIPVLWLDEDVHRALGRLGNSPVGKLCQHEVFCYFISSVIHMCAQRMKEDTRAGYDPDDIATDSVLYRVMEYCIGGRPTPSEVEGVLAQALANPGTVAAYAEGQTRLHSSIVSALEGQ